MQSCLKTLQLDAKQVDFLISASSTPDFNNPGLAQSVLGLFEGWYAGGLEIRQSAAGFHYAVDLAKNLIEAGTYQSIALISAEFLARMYLAREENEEVDESLDYAHSISSDAVFACLLCSQDFKEKNNLEKSAATFKVLEAGVSSHSAAAESFMIKFPSSSQCPQRITEENIISNEHLAKLDIKQFLQAAKEYFLPNFTAFVKKCTDSTSPALFLSHAPTAKILTQLEADCGLIEEFDIFTGHGYQAAAGIGNTLVAILERGKIRQGDLLHSVALGAGLNWGYSMFEVY